MVKHDVVYFVKNYPVNEELRYSLRSVEQNWPYNKVWFAGGCPNDIKPDRRMKLIQTSPTKWENVRNMMVEVCKNDEITEDFWLFNDDFFIMEPIEENAIAWVDGTLTSKIEQVREKYQGEDSAWSKNLGRLLRRLYENNKGERNYAIHVPMLVNRKKMLEVLEANPDIPMARALYGNWWDIEAQEMKDPKFASPDDKDPIIGKLKLLSTSDDSFRAGYIGRIIRDKFQTKSRFEV